MDEEKLMHTEPLFLSGDEDSISQCLTSDLYLIGDYGDQYDTIDEFMVQPTETSLHSPSHNSNLCH